MKKSRTVTNTPIISTNSVPPNAGAGGDPTSTAVEPGPASGPGVDFVSAVMSCHSNPVCGGAGKRRSCHRASVVPNGSITSEVMLARTAPRPLGAYPRRRDGATDADLAAGRRPAAPDARVTAVQPAAAGQRDRHLPAPPELPGDRALLA